MKNHFFRKSTAAVMALAISALAVPFNAYAGDQQQTGKTSDGYDYELWNQNYQGQASMQLGSNGGFSCSWSNIENALFRTGKKLGSTKSWQDYGGIQYQYDVDYTPKGNSYMCVYGWTEQPTVEYYIVEAWGDWRPPGSNNPKAKITVDGKSYDLFTSTRVNQPSIHGNETFEQYWSVRTTNDAAVNQKRNLKGVITVSDHFAAWEKAGMKMGKMYEVAFNIEGYRSSGEANVKKAQLNLGNITTGTGTQPVVTSPPKEADSNGYYFNTSFESDSDDWKGRGDASVDVVSSNYADGKKSLFVSGRNDNWNGAEIALDPSTYRSGETYSFGVAVMQDSESSTSMKMTLQYEDSTGEAHYDEVATADAESGKWTALGNPGFTIPSDASNMYLYIEAPDSLADFYIDSAFAGIKGKSVSISSSASSQTVTTVAVTKTGQPTTTTKTNSSQGTGLKGKFAPWFKIGTSVSPHELSSGASFLKENYNSITPENELKPDSIIDQTACQQKGNNVNTQVNLSRAAQTLKFCEDNGISLRGHTFVWYSQTPDWFFRENFSTNGAYVSPQIMDQRLESFIKNTFDAIKTQYPKLDLYSYDVCNELFVNDGGGLRPANNSNWVKVYGDDSFVIKAFQYARKYAPEGCKLYINDYNEYIPAKTNDIYNMAMKLKELGVIDGIGMQSHLDTGYPDAKTYETALKKFLSTGLEVQITELDITCSDFSAQANLYESIFKLAMENSAKIPAVTIWGTQDNVSWRSSQNPLLFSQGYKPKPAYDKVVSLISTFPKPLDENPDAKSQNQTWGDANEDTNVDMSDAVIIMQSLANPSKYSLSDAGNANADVNLSGNGITNADALAVQKYLVGILESLPESYSDDWSFPDASKANYQYNQGGGNNYIQYTQRTQDTTKTTTTTTNTYTVPLITESAASDEFKPFNYEANKQYKAAPDYYYNTCQQQGKVTKETYNGIRGSKTLNVYTPYNYDPSKKYNIFYLMHGGGENENTLFYQNDTMIQNLLDNMIMNGELEPLIVVTPTFNGNGSEAGNFYEELRQSVIPFVEGKYSTYAKSTSAADIAASRMHRAYGGFSMGAVSTWAVIQNDLDIVGYFMPLSGDHWQGQGAYGKAKSIADAVDKSGLKPNQYFIFAATGSNDIAYPNVNPQVDEMKKMSQFKFTSDFSQGNFYFMVAQGNEHWWGQVRNYVYDALPYFFHESGN